MNETNRQPETAAQRTAPQIKDAMSKGLAGYYGMCAHAERHHNGNVAQMMAKVRAAKNSTTTYCPTLQCNVRRVNA